MKAEKHSPEYLAYIRSPVWRKRRHQLIKTRNNKCERCGVFRFGRAELEVHHLNYERLGREKDTDLQVVCCHCHGLVDAERAAQVTRDNATKLHEARFEGWARAKHGDDWHLDSDPGMREEFDEFLERVSE